MTALMAGIAEHTSLAPLGALLRRGADVGCLCTTPRQHDVRGCVGQHATNSTALALAVRCEREDVVEMLLEGGAGWYL